MRYLIHEMDYERPVASGRFRYVREDLSTGTVEAWRYSEALEGYKVLRVDLEEKAGSDSHVLLIHGLIKPDGDHERIKFRLWGAPEEISGDIQFENRALVISQLVTYRVDGQQQRLVDEIETGQERYFAVPGTAGLALAASRCSSGSMTELLTLERDTAFQVRAQMTQIDVGQEAAMVVLGQEIPTRPYSIGWGNSMTALWLDRNNFPVKAVMLDGIVAEETAYWRFEFSPQNMNRAI